MKRITIAVHEKTDEFLREQCRKENRSMSNLINTAIISYFNAKPDPRDDERQPD